MDAQRGMQQRFRCKAILAGWIWLRFASGAATCILLADPTIRTKHIEVLTPITRVSTVSHDHLGRLYLNSAEPAAGPGRFVTRGRDTNVFGAVRCGRRVAAPVRRPPYRPFTAPRPGGVVTAAAERTVIPPIQCVEATAT